MEVIVIMAVGLGVLYLSLTLWIKSKKLTRKGLRAEGIILDSVQSGSINSKAQYPIVRFCTDKKECITEEYSISLSLLTKSKGDKVTVLYDRDNPREFIIDSYMTTYLPYILFLFSLFILGLGAWKLLHIQL